MRKAFKAVKKNRGAPGIDKVSINMFERNLQQNLDALRKRLKRGTYIPYPLRRKFIPKGRNKFRPLGIPAVRDRVAQEVIRRLIEPYFEPYFSKWSFGFRPGRSCHQAVREIIRLRKLGYTHVLDADIKSFFDNIPHDLIKTKAVENFKDKIRTLTIRKYNFSHNVIDSINAVNRGFANYFDTDFSDTRRIFRQLDEFTRRRLRCMKTKRFCRTDNRRLKNNFFFKRGLKPLYITL